MEALNILCNGDGEFEETNIETLHLSTRAYNGLKAAGIDTVEELALKTRKEIAGLNNMGKKTLDEIEEELMFFGIELK